MRGSRIAGMAGAALLGMTMIARADVISPTLSEPASPPFTMTVTTSPGGDFPAGSFFDVFVDVSVDSGPYYTQGEELAIPGNQVPTAINLTGEAGHTVEVQGLAADLPSASLGLPVNFEIQFIPLDPGPDVLSPDTPSIFTSWQIVPEPGSLGLLAAGIAGLAFRRRARPRVTPG